jgi:hypothetical protein
VFNFQNGKFKGSFDNLSINGNGVIEFNNGTIFEGNFINGNCKKGKLQVTFDNAKQTVTAKANIGLNVSILKYNDSDAELTINFNDKNIEKERYVGLIDIMYIDHFNNNKIKIRISKGKQYLNNVLKYDGEFNMEFKYEGTGIVYHPNGYIHMNGKFHNGDPMECDYFDESGNLIYSDYENYSQNVVSNGNSIPNIDNINEIQNVVLNYMNNLNNINNINNIDNNIDNNNQQ